MRAIISENIDAKEIIIEGDSARHLIKVIRIKEGEELLVLNGLGARALAKVSAIEGKKVKLIVLNFETIEKDNSLTLALGLPKKEAFEDIVRAAVEIGISKIIPVSSDFSQHVPKFGPRIDKIIESSLIQSNSPYFLELNDLMNFDELIQTFSDFDKVLYFCSHQNFSVKKELGLLKDDKILMLIGPEAGLSNDEEEALKGHEKVFFINLPTNILRSPTAVSVCSGMILGYRLLAKR